VAGRTTASINQLIYQGVLGLVDGLEKEISWKKGLY
jgi:hypothetical protein